MKKCKKNIIIIAIVLLVFGSIFCSSYINKGYKTIKSVNGIIQSNQSETTKIAFDITAPEFGANGDDTKNDFTSIQKALDKAKEVADGIIVYIPDGTYYINGALNVYSNTEILLSDNATVEITVDKSMLIARHLDQNGEICSSLNCQHGGYSQWKNISIKGGTWNFNSTGKVNVSGFVFAHGENLKIENTTLENNAGHTINPSCSKDIMIDNVTIKNQISAEPKKADDTNEAIHLDTADSGRGTNKLSVRWNPSKKCNDTKLYFR